jgi:hypothetical protein
MPANYRVDGGSQPIAGRLVNAASIDAKIRELEISCCSWLLTEAYSGVSDLDLACIVHNF